MITFLIIIIVSAEMNSIFSNKVEFSIKENANIGTVVGNLYKKLVLSGNISKLELIKNDYGGENYFILEKVSGNLVVRSFLDREAICENNKDDDCVITLLVDTDTDLIQMKIKIEDTNDNSPRFLTVQKVIQIQENIPLGVTYFLPIAQDKDSSKFGINNYSISNFRAIDNKQHEKYSNKDQYFRVEGTHAPLLKVIGKIDREEVASFVFLFVATDSEYKSGTCTVTVVVTDVNDNSPEWKKNSYKVKIKECQQQGEILEFDATDRDDPNTSNGRISYRLSDRILNREKIAQIFYINDNKLYLSNNRPAELSNSGVLTLYIIAADGNGRLKETSVQIMIEDCNDHSPIISITKRYGNIFENTKIKKSMSIVSVKDSDRGRNGQFDCTLNDTNVLNLVKKHVDINQNQIIYKIETNGDYSFDREHISVYSVEILCVDQGQPSLSSSQMFSINILDLNDNAPKFEDKTLVFHVMENNAIGSVVGQVKAVDHDSGINGHIRYNVLKLSNYFIISIYGEIQSKIRFDREEQDHYEFEVIASDNGNPPLNDTMNVKVIVMDMNDCPPIFNKAYVFKVIESYGETSKNERLGEVKATDKDFGINGTVNYRLINIRSGDSAMLKPQLNRLIRVNSDGGISIYGNLDRETISSIQVIIEAYDNGNPRLVTKTTVTVEVLDINDNAPTFLFPSKVNRFVNISLDSEIGSHIGLVSAIDPDQGVNGTIYYMIILSDKQYPLPFKMESNGKIILLSDLQKFSKSRRLPDKIIVKAFDLGIQSKSSITTLYFNYQDSVNDLMNQNAARKSTESTNNNSLWKQGKKGNKYNFDNSYSSFNLSDGMMLLYCLAAILFFVFIIVFSVLLYIYCSRTYSNVESLSKKHYKSSNSQFSSNPNLNELHQMNLNACDFNSGKNDSGAAVCFLNDDGSSYTHLMMLNNNKYTPMIHSTVTKNNFQYHGDFSQPELLSASQTYLNSTINNSLFQMPSPQESKTSMKKLSLTTNINCSNDTQNYSTLQDKINFDSIKRKQSIHTLTSASKLTLDGSEFCKEEKEFHSPYVTSSFV